MHKIVKIVDGKAETNITQYDDSIEIECLFNGIKEAGISLDMNHAIIVLEEALRLAKENYGYHNEQS